LVHNAIATGRPFRPNLSRREVSGIVDIHIRAYRIALGDAA
jgi:hypothetical protein